jgi:mannose-6-phosphate isomerase-like protein (cupin superfamily)
MLPRAPMSTPARRLRLTEDRMTEQPLTLVVALARLPGPTGERYVELFQHGTLSIELYAPRGHDPQSPHTKDEVYVVIQGSGQFRNGDTRHRFGPGDVLFVPAGVTHRFEEFTDDLAVWVIFYGPEGGERAP